MPLSNKGHLVLRFSLSALFLWFGYEQIAHPNAWIGFLPEWTAGLPISAVAFVKLNGAMEVALGAAMAIGFFTRLSALVLGLHLLVIAISVGKDIDAAIGVRDGALALAALSLAIDEVDTLTFDFKRKAKRAAKTASAAPTA